MGVNLYARDRGADGRVECFTRWILESWRLAVGLLAGLVMGPFKELRFQRGLVWAPARRYGRMK